jgi:D-alanine-D-alanine ligase-like ATP-grasp enzyme
MAEAPALVPSLKALADVCHEEGYSFSIIDKHSGQLVRVGHGAHFFFAGTGRVSNFPLNSAVAASIARDKAFAYQTLAAAGIAVPDYGYFFLDARHQGLRGTGRERADAFAYAEHLGYPVFVKPIDGSKGALCDVAFRPEDLSSLLDRIARFHHAALIQRVITGQDRRLFYLDGRVIFGYRRLRAVLRGDGKSSIKGLLERYNKEVIATGVREITEDSPFLRETLSQRGHSLDHVLDLGEEVQVAARANISAGGRIQDFSEEVREAWVRWARYIAATLGLRACAVDFFAPHETADPNELSLIEVNSNPSLEGLMASGLAARVRAIWREVAGTYFAECQARA